MPLVSAIQSHPLVDGRQSGRAMQVRRGLQSMLSTMGAASVPELTLANGRRADLCGLFPDGTFWIIEIKSSLQDLRADHKWTDYTDFCDALYFATLPDVPLNEFPEEAGLILADKRDAEIVRAVEKMKMAPSRRKAVINRFATVAAQRLYTAELLAPQ
ncbi:MAG: MmcB family DNA repair protein [Pseudomonadota bacterium]